VAPLLSFFRYQLLELGGDSNNWDGFISKALAIAKMTDTLVLMTPLSILLIWLYSTSIILAKVRMDKSFSILYFLTL